MGLQFGYLMGGSILVETVFTWPGSGFLLSKAIINRDIPVLQGTILALSLIFVATNLVVDLLQSMIDPRIRRADERAMVAQGAIPEDYGSADDGGDWPYRDQRARLLAVGAVPAAL